MDRDGTLRRAGAHDAWDGRPRARHDRRGPIARTRIGTDRPRLWRVTAALAALVLIITVVLAAQGSLTVLANRPSAGAAGQRSWERWCGNGLVRMDRVHVAYCARVEGIVLRRTFGPSKAESHLAVIGDFHLLVVRLDTGRKGVPGIGARVIAIGPMVRARNGQLEIQAFRLRRA